MSEKKSVKLLVCYHKPDILFKDEILTPIHVGRSLFVKTHEPESEDYKWMFENCIGDDTGENISQKNSSYNELTAVYWAWKNYDSLGNPDYIGLIHYRRHFIFDKKRYSEVHSAVPDNYFGHLNYNPESLCDILEKQDFVYHYGLAEPSVETQYSDNHKIDDLRKAMSIVVNQNPDYQPVVEKYLDGNRTSYYNMFIMPRDLFFRYCKWLFDVLSEFEKEVDLSDKRLFISERLTGVFFEKLKKERYSGLNLPVSIIREPVTIPVVIIWKNLEQCVYVIGSHRMNTQYGHTYRIYVLGNVPGEAKAILESLATDKLQIVFKDLVGTASNVIKAISDTLPEVNKCVYLGENVVASKGNIGDLYLLSNVDDFLIAGPKIGTEGRFNVISSEVLVLNLKRLRKHGIAEPEMSSYLSFTDMLNSCYRGELAFCFPGSTVNTSTELINKGFFGEELKRCYDAAYVFKTDCCLSYVDFIRYLVSKESGVDGVGYDKKLHEVNLKEVIALFDSTVPYRRHYLSETVSHIRRYGLMETLRVIRRHFSH